MNTQTSTFPTDPRNLPFAHAPRLHALGDGSRLDLTIAPVAKRIGDAEIRMLAYNGSVPGPTLRVRQGTEVVIDVVNQGDLDATVHWHGLRLANEYDGTPETQAPMPVGGGFRYRLTFPDPGVYWYHPHIREDYTQEMGLYGNIVVEPADPDYWPKANRELALTLDDLLLEQGKVAPFSRSESNYTAMGRFGNVLLVNGESSAALHAQRGEIVRFYLTNTANTRVFDLAIPGARMKLVGGDSGRVERERFVESVVIAPSERVVVDVLFDAPGSLRLEHRTPGRTYALAAITVGQAPAEPALAAEFERLRTNADMTAERQRMLRYLDAAPDKTLALVAEMNLGVPEVPNGGALVYYCPMHPRVVSEEQGRCPLCKMKLVARVADETPAQDSHGHTHEHGHGHAPASTTAGGIEWEDDMVEVNRTTTPANTRWKLVDRATGAEGRAIDWRFFVGDQVKIRIVNEMESDHPMHHPFHVHGAGRFLVLARDGVPESNLVWKDTVLIPTGQVVDILLDVTNPGRWMAHCHIAEHHESGMMLTFDVEP